MSLPTVCPKTGSGPCIGNKCQMYVLDWRSNEEYCIVGYYSASNRKNLGEPVVDNYAAKVRSNSKNSTKVAIFVDARSKSDSLKETEKPGRQSRQAADNVILKVKKTKNITDLGDIPDDYEEQFWEKL
ncbi:MAG: hypothetical protein K8R17_04400 [Methanosarcinales archaeon]|nr:hypothetical protein [Methanosarcinales archaeon]